MLRRTRAKFDDPAVMKHITGWLIVGSIVEWVIAGVFGWVHLVTYVSHLSQFTMTLSLIPWWQGTRVEKRQTEEDVPRDVVTRLVEETSIENAHT